MLRPEFILAECPVASPTSTYFNCHERLIEGSEAVLFDCVQGFKGSCQEARFRTAHHCASRRGPWADRARSVRLQEVSSRSATVRPKDSPYAAVSHIAREKTLVAAVLARRLPPKLMGSFRGSYLRARPGGDSGYVWHEERTSCFFRRLSIALFLIMGAEVRSSDDKIVGE